MGLFDDILKGGISGIGEAIKGVIGAINAPKEQKAEIEAKIEVLLTEHEEKMRALAMDYEKAVMADAQNARGREVEFVKATGHFDWMMWFLALTGVGIFFYLIYYLVNKNLPEANKDLISHGVGIIEGVVISIFSYYFGSSAGSRIKDMKKGPSQ